MTLRPVLFSTAQSFWVFFFFFASRSTVPSNRDSEAPAVLLPLGHTTCLSGDSDSDRSLSTFRNATRPHAGVVQRPRARAALSVERRPGATARVGAQSACAVPSRALGSSPKLPNHCATLSFIPLSGALSPFRTACPTHSALYVTSGESCGRARPGLLGRHRGRAARVRAAREVASAAAPAPSAARVRARLGLGAPRLAAAGPAAVAASAAVVVSPPLS